MERVFLALVRFYEHNDPLVFLVPIILVAFTSLIIKPRRRVVFLLLGSVLLLLQFEYTKVLFKELKSDWLNQIFAEDFRFRKFLLVNFFFQDIVPFLMSLLGWSLLVISAIL